MQFMFSRSQRERIQQWISTVGLGARPPHQVIGQDCKPVCTLALADPPGGHFSHVAHAGCRVR
eukprot:10880947-Lingulodinium_polyedra.AAC.1